MKYKIFSIAVLSYEKRHNLNFLFFFELVVFMQCLRAVISVNVNESSISH